MLEMPRSGAMVGLKVGGLHAIVLFQPSLDSSQRASWRCVLVERKSMSATGGSRQGQAVPLRSAVRHDRWLTGPLEQQGTGRRSWETSMQPAHAAGGSCNSDAAVAGGTGRGAA